MIVLLVLVFDPLAILLVVSANMTWAQLGGEKISFASQPSVTEDFGIESDEIQEPEPSPPSAVDDAADVMSGVIDDTQLRKLDRETTRTKLELIAEKFDMQPVNLSKGGSNEKDTKSCQRLFGRPIKRTSCRSDIQWTTSDRFELPASDEILHFNRQRNRFTR